MVLHFECFDIAAAPFPLPLHIVAQLRRGHLLRLLGGDKEFIGDDSEGDIFADTAFQRLVHTGEGALGIMIEMPVFEAIIVDTVGGRTVHQGLALEMLDRAAVSDAGSALERLDIEHRAGFDLELDITGVLRREMLDILIREGEHMLTALRNHPAAQPYAQHAQHRRRDGIGHHEPVKTHTRCLHGDDLGVAREFGSEEDDGYEDEQGTEHIHIIGDEGQVVLEDDLVQRNLVLEEIIHFLRQVKDDGDRKNEHDREKERAQEFLDDIPVYPLQSRCMRLGKTEAFHEEKSPANICSRACVTRSR